jgi:hypothetical protein
MQPSYTTNVDIFIFIKYLRLYFLNFFLTSILLSTLAIAIYAFQGEETYLVSYKFPPESMVYEDLRKILIKTKINDISGLKVTSLDKTIIELRFEGTELEKINESIQELKNRLDYYNQHIASDSTKVGISALKSIKHILKKKYSKELILSIEEIANRYATSQSLGESMQINLLNQTDPSGALLGLYLLIRTNTFFEAGRVFEYLTNSANLTVVTQPLPLANMFFGFFIASMAFIYLIPFGLYSLGFIQLNKLR